MLGIQNLFSEFNLTMRFHNIEWRRDECGNLQMLIKLNFSWCCHRRRFLMMMVFEDKTYASRNSSANKTEPKCGLFNLVVHFQ